MNQQKVLVQICAQICAHEVKMCACVSTCMSKCVHTYLCLVCTCFYTKLYENCIDSPLLCHDLKFKIS